MEQREGLEGFGYVNYRLRVREERNGKPAGIGICEVVA